MSSSKKQLELAEKLAARRARHGGKKSKGRKVHPAVPDVSPGKRKKVRSHRHAHAKAAAMAKPMTLMQLDDSRGDGERLRQARQHNSIEARQKALCDILSHKIDLTDQRQSLVMHKYNCLRRARNAIEIMIIVTAALLTLMHATMAEFEGTGVMTGTAWKKWVDFATSMLSIVVAGSIALTAAIARFFKLQSKMEKASNASEFALITASRLRVLEERVRAIPFDGEIEDEAQLEDAFDSYEDYEFPMYLEAHNQIKAVLPLSYLVKHLKQSQDLSLMYQQQQRAYFMQQDRILSGVADDEPDELLGQVPEGGDGEVDVERGEVGMSESQFDDDDDDEEDSGGLVEAPVEAAEEAAIATQIQAAPKAVPRGLSAIDDPDLPMALNDNEL